MPIERFDSIAPVTAGVDESFERYETTGRMWAALARLGADERTMSVMHEVDGLAYQEIAATLGLSFSAVESKVVPSTSDVAKRGVAMRWRRGRPTTSELGEAVAAQRVIVRADGARRLRRHTSRRRELRW